MNQTKILCLFVLQCRIAIESFCVFSVLSTIRFVKKIIARSANDVKSRTRRVDRYVLEFASIFFSLMIHSCLDSLHQRQWIFVEIRTFFWSLTVRSTNAIISSTLCFDFANFVVALRFERSISFRWRTCSTREKQHVSNCSICKQRKRQELFFAFRYVFSKLSYFVCD